MTQEAITGAMKLAEAAAGLSSPAILIILLALFFRGDLIPRKVVETIIEKVALAILTKIDERLARIEADIEAIKTTQNATNGRRF